MSPAVIPPDDPGDHGKSSSAAGGTGLTDAELRATPVDVTVVGEVEVKNDAGTALSVVGPLTDAELRATPVDVTGTVTITDGSGPVTVDGTVSVGSETAAAFTHGQNTDVDSGADENLVVGGGSNPATKGVLVKTLSANTGTIYVGATGVTSATGMPLEAGEAVIFPVDDANKLFVRASVDNQGIAWMAL